MPTLKMMLQKSIEFQYPNVFYSKLKVKLSGTCYRHLKCGLHLDFYVDR